MGEDEPVRSDPDGHHGVDVLPRVEVGDDLDPPAATGNILELLPDSLAVEPGETGELQLLYTDPITGGPPVDMTWSPGPSWGVEEVLVADLDLDMVRQVRNEWQFYRDRRPAAYGEIVAP